MAQQFRKEGVLFSFDNNTCTATAAGETWYIDKQEAEVLKTLFMTAPASIHRISKEVRFYTTLRSKVLWKKKKIKII